MDFHRFSCKKCVFFVSKIIKILCFLLKKWVVLSTTDQKTPIFLKSCCWDAKSVQKSVFFVLFVLKNTWKSSEFFDYFVASNRVCICFLVRRFLFVIPVLLDFDFTNSLKIRQNCTNFASKMWLLGWIFCAKIGVFDRFLRPKHTKIGWKFWMEFLNGESLHLFEVTPIFIYHIDVVQKDK